MKDRERIANLTKLRGNNTDRGRWSGHRAVHPEQFRMFVGLEEDADLIRTVGAEVVPGIIQCEPYVRALYSERSMFENSVEVSFRKSSFSDANAKECVEVAGTLAAVRHSKNPDTI